ncbi:MAG: hypothetical protein AABY22_09445 [Nanoarchaeota archaeon]
MALKDWKKKNSEEEISWIRKSNNHEVYIGLWSAGKEGTEYAVYTIYPNGNEETLKTGFKTIKMAEFYARQYMRTH